MSRRVRVLAAAGVGKPAAEADAREEPTRRRTLSAPSLITTAAQGPKRQRVLVQPALGEVLKGARAQGSRPPNLEVACAASTTESVTVAVDDAASDGTTSGEESDVNVATRSREMKERGRVRTRNLLARALQLPPGRSPLEELSVQHNTLMGYRKEVENFERYCRRVNLRDYSDGAMDAALVGHMTELFVAGELANKAEKLMAGIMFLNPDFSRYGHRKLPRSWRALKGYRRLAPGRSRQPVPWAVWCGLSVWMAQQGETQMAIAVLLGVTCYLRPSELVNLQKMSLVAPAQDITAHWSLLLFPQEAEKTSKTGSKDDSIAIDNKYMKWLNPVWAELSRGRGSDSLWNFSYLELVKTLKAAVAATGVMPLVPYQMRHSGPSIDRANNRRSLDECRKRGRWMSWRSLIRYEKAARLSREWNELSSEVRAKLNICEKHLEELILRRPSAPIVTWRPQVQARPRVI